MPRSSETTVSYIALRFDASAGDADAWSDALLDAGALSVDVSDSSAGTPEESPLYGEPGFPVAAIWCMSRVVALFPADSDWRSALGEASRATARPIPEHSTSPVAERDWVRATQAQFGPIEIAPDFWIVPTWSEVPDKDATVLRLDPGLAFGTGSHPTTRLCLEWLHANVGGAESVLDYGCGSGILALAAARLGADRVCGVDVDHQALRASEHNAQTNNVSATFCGPDSLDAGSFGIVVANILANPLILLAPAICARVDAGGRLALSGVLADQWQSVAAAYAPWFTLAPWRVCDGWVLLAGERSR
jgi:ribosomal protein L11 methyltransferase